jgi:hypothetical protein
VILQFFFLIWFCCIYSAVSIRCYAP